MTELDLGYWNIGMGIPYEYSLRDLYYLLALFGASNWFENIPDYCRKLRGDFQECEVRRLLLNIAIMVRNTMDSQNAFNLSDITGLDELSVEDKVGTLFGDEGQTKELTVREASNKIVHARVLNFDYCSEKPKVGGILNPVVHAYGEFNENKWKASINIVDYCHLSHYVL